MRKMLLTCRFGLAPALVLVACAAGVGAEAVPYVDPEGFFSVTLPEGWRAGDPGRMGSGVVIRGPAGEAGVEPVVRMTHQPSGIVTLDEQWHTRLGQTRYDLERVRFRGLEDREEEDPPYSQATYSYLQGERTFLALMRLYKHQERFFLFNATAPEEDFEGLATTFLAVFDSFRPGAGK